MGRKLDLSSLTEEEAEHVLHVVQRDMQLRKTEEERLSELKQELDEEDSRCALLSRQSGFNERCCIRCCSPFTFLLKPRRRCHHCRYNVCKRCCSYSASDKGWLCSACQKSRLLKTQSLEWFYTNVRRRFRRFGSAKVLKTLYRRHIAEQGNLAELTEESTYEESIGNEGSIYESDSTFYRHSEEHSMADTINVALRVAEEAIDEAIAKAESQPTNQEKQNEARYLRENRGELVEELTTTIVQNIIGRKMQTDRNAQSERNSDVSAAASPVHRSQSALASQPRFKAPIWRSRSAFSLLTDDIQQGKAEQKPAVSKDSTQGLKKDGAPVPTLPSWKSVDRLDKSSASSVLQSPDGNWIALQSNQLSRPSLLTKRKSLVFCALEKESSVVSAYDGMGSDTEPDADGAWGTALLEIRHKMSSNNLLNDIQPTSPHPAPTSPSSTPADQPHTDSGQNNPVQSKFPKPSFPFLKRKVPQEIRRSSSHRLSVMDINFNPEGTESSEDGLEDSRVKRTRRKRKSKREDLDREDSQSLSSSEPDYSRMLLDVVVKHRNKRKGSSEFPDDPTMDADSADTATPDVLSSGAVTPDALLPDTEEPSSDHHVLTGSLQQRQQLASKLTEQTSHESQGHVSLKKDEKEHREEECEESRGVASWQMEADERQQGRRQLEVSEEQKSDMKHPVVETNTSEVENQREERPHCPDTVDEDGVIEPCVYDYSMFEVDREFGNSLSVGTDLFHHFHDIIQEATERQSEIRTSVEIMAARAVDRSDLEREAKTFEQTACWWTERIGAGEKSKEAVECRPDGVPPVKRQQSSEKGRLKDSDVLIISAVPQRQGVRAGKRSGKAEKEQQVESREDGDQKEVAASEENHTGSTNSESDLIQLVGERQGAENETVVDDVVKALDHTEEEIESHVTGVRSLDVRQEEDKSVREETAEHEMTWGQHVETNEENEVDLNLEHCQETCKCEMAEEEVVRSGVAEEEEECEDVIFKDALDGAICGQEVFLSPEEIYKDLGNSLDLEKNLQFVSTRLQQKYSAASLRSITTEVLKVLNATEDLIHGTMGVEQAQSRDLPSLAPAQSKRLDEHLSRLEENVYVAASAVFGLEADLGDLEECARSIGTSTSEGELAHLEEQVASAAAQVQQSELQVSDIAARIAALKNAGLNVTPQTRKVQTIDTSRQRRRRLPAPPAQAKKT